MSRGENDPNIVKNNRNPALKGISAEDMINELSFLHEGLLVSFRVDPMKPEHTVFIGGGRPEVLLDSLNTLISYMQEKIPQMTTGEVKE